MTSLGIKREKQALGYAVSEVNSEALEKRAEGDVGRILAGKASGVIQALKQIKEIATMGKKEFEKQTYGMELPDTSTLIRRSLGNR